MRLPSPEPLPPDAGRTLAFRGPVEALALDSVPSERVR